MGTDKTRRFNIGARENTTLGLQIRDSGDTLDRLRIVRGNGLTPGPGDWLIGMRGSPFFPREAVFFPFSSPKS